MLASLTRYLDNQTAPREYTIVLAEDRGNDIYNAALARNVAAGYALGTLDASSLVFNDVDMVPVAGVNYEFEGQETICFLNFGGCKVSAEAFHAVNGYNPLVVGWGYEDTEFYDRLEFFGFDCERWDRSKEAERAVVRDLELRVGNAADELAHSRTYWRRRHDSGPRFVSANPSTPHYQRTDRWFSETIKKQNLGFVNSIRNSPPVDRMRHYVEHGVSSHDVDGIDVERHGRVHRLRYLAEAIWPGPRSSRQAGRIAGSGVSNRPRGRGSPDAEGTAAGDRGKSSRKES
jgi:hypothetical protein